MMTETDRNPPAPDVLLNSKSNGVPGKAELLVMMIFKVLSRLMMSIKILC